MKVLIWIGVLFVYSFILTLFDGGVGLGAIPSTLLFVAAIFAARRLCKAWDARKEQRAEQGPSAGAEETDKDKTEV